MNETNITKADQDFMHNMYLFKNPQTNESTWELVYLALLKHLSRSDNDMISSQLYQLIQKEYNMKKMMKRFLQFSPVWITLWTVICFIGVVGNAFVILVFARNRTRAVYEIFCIGLAVTDLSFLLLTVPITVLHYVLQEWIFGSFVCRAVNYITYGTMFSSAIMLVSLTSSRYLAVVRPWDHRNMTIKDAISACTISWLAGYFCSIPIAIYFNVVLGQSQRRCRDQFPNSISRQIYFSVLPALTYILPFIGIIIMNFKIVSALKKTADQPQNNEEYNLREIGKKNHQSDMIQPGPEMVTTESGESSGVANRGVSINSDSRIGGARMSKQFKRQHRRSKVTRLVIVITTTYCLCWLPTQFLNGWYYLSPNTFPHSIYLLFAKAIGQTMSYTSACLNPFIYSFISKSFQSSVKRQFPRLYLSMKRIISRSGRQADDKL